MSMRAEALPAVVIVADLGEVTAITAVLVETVMLNE
jgi:hypothetical protein